MTTNELLKLIEGKKYNLHSHTEFCDGRATMEAFARKAVEENFEIYGFSPHSPVPIVSPCNMHCNNVDRYLNEVARINSAYGDKCRFLASMEIDYLGETWGPANEYFKSLPLDYRIGSVHFLPTRSGELIDCDGSHESFVEKLKKFFNGDLRYVVETYFTHIIQMLNAGGFDILGHADKIADNASFVKPDIETESWYLALVDDLIDSIVESGVIVELNTKAYSNHNRMFPSQNILEKLLARGAHIVVNSDAHVPALINASRNEGIDVIEKLKVKINNTTAI